MKIGTIWQHFWLSRRTVLIATLACPLFCCGAVLLDIPEGIPAVGLPCLAWVARHMYQVDKCGTVSSLFAFELVTGEISYYYRTDSNLLADVIVTTFLSIPAIGCMLAGVVAFLVRACLLQAHRSQNLLAAAVACLLFIPWLVLGPRGAVILSESALQRAIARSEIPEFIAEVNAATERLGRVPRDEKELIRLLGKPVPVVPYRRCGPIRYHAASGKRFTLDFGGYSGYEFDSEKPDDGWHRYFGGVTSNTGQPQGPPSADQHRTDG